MSRTLSTLPKVTQLSNGMNVILVPQVGAKSITFQVFIKVGSRYEPRELNGASHFIEHMMFKGTKKRPHSLDITKELDRYGAEYNAFTGKGMTSYYVKIDAEKTKVAVDMLHDMLIHSKFDAKELNRERGVIIEEINMYEDNPQRHVDEMLEAALFGDHPLGWNIAGPRENIRNISRTAMVGYRDRYYIPSRMTLIAAGNIDGGMLKLLEQTFGKVKAPKTLSDHEFKPHLGEQAAEMFAFKKKQTEQTQLGIAFTGLPTGHKDLSAMGLLTTILGGSMSSRLFIQVRERRGLCYSIYAGHDAMEDTGMFSIMAGLERTKLEEAVAAIAKELKLIKTKLVDKEELARAKDHIRGSLMLAFEDSATQADWYGRQWVNLKKLYSPEDRIKQINKVKAEDIRTLTKRLFDPKHLATAVIGPYEDADKVKRMLQKHLTK